MKYLKKWFYKHIKLEWLHQKIKQFFYFFSLISSSFFIFIIRGLRPLLGAAHCKYHVGCTDFAVYQLKNKPFFKALWAIIKRVLSCNPLNI